MSMTISLPSIEDPDAIVIGAGHNGLITAAYLARAGLRVLVLEARSSVGGCSSTESFVGARVNICNCDHITFRSTPIMEELELGELGLDYIDIDPNQINVPWDGRPAWPIFQSVEKTLEALGHTYPHQVEAYRAYCRDAMPVARLVLTAAAAGPRRTDLLRAAASNSGSGIARLLTWSRMSAANVMRQYFQDENLIAPAMATGPIVWGLSPELPGTGLGALTYAMRHLSQVGRPVGGSGRLAEVLAARVQTFGGAISTGTAVAGIIVEREMAVGVVLANGEHIKSRIVVSAADPRRTFLQWVHNPPACAGAVIERWRNAGHQQGYESKIDALIPDLPIYRQIDSTLADRLEFSPHGVSTMITPTIAEMHDAYLAMETGHVSNRPVMFANVPTHHDPSMASVSSETRSRSNHVFSLETLFTPYAIPGGWENSTEPRRWLDLHDSFLTEPIADRIEQWRAMTPDRYEREFHLPEGHATSFAGGPLAALRGRPRELVRYRTPIDGLYLCGAATFPGAGIWGASGRHCAREILGTI